MKKKSPKFQKFMEDIKERLSNITGNKDFFIDNPDLEKFIFSNLQYFMSCIKFDDENIEIDYDEFFMQLIEYVFSEYAKSNILKIHDPIDLSDFSQEKVFNIMKSMNERDDKCLRINKRSKKG